MKTGCMFGVWGASWRVFLRGAHRDGERMVSTSVTAEERSVTTVTSNHIVPISICRLELRLPASMQLVDNQTVRTRRSERLSAEVVCISFSNG